MTHTGNPFDAAAPALAECASRNAAHHRARYADAHTLPRVTVTGSAVHVPAAALADLPDGLRGVILTHGKPDGRGRLTLRTPDPRGMRGRIVRAMTDAADAAYAPEA